MRFDCAGSHNIIVRNIIIITTSIIIINFILHYLPTPPTLFGVSCRDNFTCLSSSPAFSLLGSWNAQVRKCIYIYFLQGWFMMILHPKGMDTICQVPGPKSVRTLGGGGPHLEISSSNIVPRQTSRPKLLIYEINVKSMWNQCEINVNIYLIYLQGSSGAHETSFETILRGPENGVLSATIGPPSRPCEDPSCFTDPNISVISWIIKDLYIYI